MTTLRLRLWRGTLRVTRQRVKQILGRHQALASRPISTSVSKRPIRRSVRLRIKKTPICEAFSVERAGIEPATSGLQRRREADLGAAWTQRNGLKDFIRHHRARPQDAGGVDQSVDQPYSCSQCPPAIAVPAGVTPFAFDGPRFVQRIAQGARCFLPSKELLRACGVRGAARAMFPSRRCSRSRARSGSPVWRGAGRAGYVTARTASSP